MLVEVEALAATGFAALVPVGFTSGALLVVVGFCSFAMSASW
jgi:hypothetical protein